MLRVVYVVHHIVEVMARRDIWNYTRCTPDHRRRPLRSTQTQAITLQAEYLLRSSRLQAHAKWCIDTKMITVMLPVRTTRLSMPSVVEGNEVYGGSSLSACNFLRRSSDDAVVKGEQLIAHRGLLLAMLYIKTFCNPCIWTSVRCRTRAI